MATEKWQAACLLHQHVLRTAPPWPAALRALADHLAEDKDKGGAANLNPFQAQALALRHSRVCLLMGPPTTQRLLADDARGAEEVRYINMPFRNGVQHLSAPSIYGAAIEALEIYLNDVELPPTTFPDYREANDMVVPSLCQGSFCI